MVLKTIPLHNLKKRLILSCRAGKKKKNRGFLCASSPRSLESLHIHQDPIHTVYVPLPGSRTPRSRCLCTSLNNQQMMIKKKKKNYISSQIPKYDYRTEKGILSPPSHLIYLSFFFGHPPTPHLLLVYNNQNHGALDVLHKKNNNGNSQNALSFIHTGTLSSSSW